MTHDDAFLADICEHPDEDAPRLVYADWLDEHGQSERAELIRVQCSLARLRYDDDRVSDLQAREYRLLSRYLPAWREGYRYAKFRRGFIEQLDFCGPGSFVKDVPDLFRSHPVRDVEIGSQEAPGWGRLVAGCPHLSRVETLRLTERRSHVTDFSDFLAILSSPHLTNLRALDASGGHEYGDDGLLELLGSPGRTTRGRSDNGLLPSLRRLRRLSLNEMRLTDRGVRALAESPLAGTLTHIDLSRNEGITADGIRAMIDSPLWSRLEELNLGHISFRRGEAIRLLVGALARSRISKLGLSGALVYNARQLDLPEALAAAPSWGKVEALDLSWNGFTKRRLRILTECPHLAGLKWLSLQHQPQTLKDMQRLAACPHLAGLTGLRVGGSYTTDPGDAGMATLAASPHLRRLVYLSVNDPNVGDAGAAAFARSPNAAHLRVWILPGSVGEAGLHALAESPYLGRLTTLIFQGGDGYGPSPPATDTAAVALARSTHLPNLAFIERCWHSLSGVGLRALLRCERLAWHGWSGQYPSASLRRAYRDRFGDFEGRQLILVEPEPLFPWASYAFT
jgi:uncharacterized protein (TIGR02996 family)